MVPVSLELLWLLIPGGEVFLSLLSIEFEEVWIEVSRVGGQWLISPSSRVLIIDGAYEPLVGLFRVPFELFGEWCLHGRLNFLDLVTVMSRIVENLPLLDVTLVHLECLLLDALLSEDVLNQVLALFKSLTEAPVIGNT